MKAFSRPFTVAMAAVLAMLSPDIAVVAEHSARHIFNPGDVSTSALDQDVRHYQSLGFHLVRRTYEIAFLSRGYDNIELIPRTWTEHEALAVQTKEHLELLKEAVVATEDFEQIDSSDSGSTDVIWHLFRHKATGVVIQIIWRKEQLFSNIKFTV